ncbi:complement receptor type 2 isoform X2 [Paroedura picta]|uniref:complement receptor type 2 isoform X2 n=1 Tax=Paroedura picta TaxID=143630 RepID=UPI0040579D24
MVSGCTFSLLWCSAALLVIAAGDQGHCGPPTRLYFAELIDEYKNKTSFPVGSTVTYRCRPGYGRFGRNSRTCLESLEWSEAPKFCKEKSCGNPGEPQNGQLIVPNDILFGSTVHFACSEGHRLIGPSSIRCIIIGQRVAWDREIPLCQRIPCYPPPDIPHGKLKDTYKQEDYSYGNAVTYTCDKDYPHNGDPFIHCTTKDGKNGVWAGHLSCGVTPCPAPQVENGSIVAGDSGTYTYKHKVTLGCSAGHVLTGSREIYCQADGTWDPPVPLCEQVKQCHRPPDIQHGIHSNQEAAVFTSGMFVKYTCEPGYTLIGEKTIYCTQSGTWSPGAPHCTVKQCHRPPDIQHGIHSNQEAAVFTSGMFVKYTCEPGYTLIGEKTIYCTQSGTWSPAAPHCTVKQCHRPPDIQHGIHSNQEAAVFTSGMFVKYTCEPGYTLIGEKTIYCTQSGTWSPGAPHCTVKQCHRPPDIQHGIHSNQEAAVFTSGMFVKYTCEPGYTLIGEKTIYCTQSGTWSPAAPHCTVKQCHRPPDIQHGIHSNQEAAVFTSGMFVKYTCEPGYTLIGEKTIYCTQSGTWSPAAPHCTGSCGPPMSLKFAELTDEYKNKTSFPVNSTVKYMCQPGYAGLRTSAKCLSNLMWSDIHEFCRKKSCRNPGDPENGRLIVPEDILFGSTVNFTCDVGHKLIGQPSIRCVLSGQNVIWSGEIPFCQRIQCYPPPDIPHGKQEGKYKENYSYGDAVTYTCDKGYVHVGDPFIHCTTKDGENGVWVGCQSCGVTPCPAPQVENGSIVAGDSGNYTYKHKVTLGCSAGHVLTGSREIYCQADGTWDPPVPLCEWVLHCPEPPDIDNGHHNATVGEIFLSQRSVTYFCDSGYSLIGKASISCTSSGDWSLPQPHCEVLQCKPPPSISNGDHDGYGLANFPIGVYINYTCNPGYLLIGDASRHCTTSGTWSQPIPQCDVMTCPLPPEIAHGSYFGTNFSYQMSVIYVCDAGYSLVGDPMVTCTLQGSDSANWSELPQCKGCLAPQEIANGKPDTEVLEDFAFGSSVTYHCDPGYFLTGAATIYCLSSGMWEPSVPKCKAIGCTLPQIPGSKRAKAENLFQPGDNVTVWCEDGYVLEGSPYIQCQHDFTWDLPVPVCKPGFYLLASISFGSLVGFLLFLAISGIIWMAASNRNKAQYAPANSKVIADSSNGRI